MKLWITRAMLAAAAIIFAIGGVLHAVAYFSKASFVIESANVKTFFGHELKVLWLADSTTLIALALIVGLLSIRPSSVSKPVLLLLGLIPGATTALLYWFLGPFYAAHMLLVATALVIVGGSTLNTQRGANDSQEVQIGGSTTQSG
jgi:hypothetical protein